jgi:hypothetical protein
MAENGRTGRINSTPATAPAATELVARRNRRDAVAPGMVSTRLHDSSSTLWQCDSSGNTIPTASLRTVDECVGVFVFPAEEKLSGYGTDRVVEVNAGRTCLDALRRSARHSQ